MKKSISMLLMPAVLWLYFGTAIAYGQNNSSINDIINDTAFNLVASNPNPQLGIAGGEWAIIGLARSGCAVNTDYFQKYYHNIENYVKEHQGVLHERKFTEYSRVVLALTAMGADPSNVGGYNLLLPLGDYDKTIWQGISGPIWALIALDSGGYDIPINKSAATQATRQLYLENILKQQLPDGGFALSGLTGDPDITAMAVQALANYREQVYVQKAIDKAIICLAKQQNGDGGYTSWNRNNSESVFQVIIALGSMGIEINDVRFTKNGHTLIDKMLTFYIKGSGFKHNEAESISNPIATEQALLALSAVRLHETRSQPLYKFTGESGKESDQNIIAPSIVNENASKILCRILHNAIETNEEKV